MVDLDLVEEIALELMAFAPFKRDSALRSMHWRAVDAENCDRVAAIEQLAKDLDVTL